MDYGHKAKKREKKKRGANLNSLDVLPPIKRARPVQLFMKDDWIENISLDTRDSDGHKMTPIQVLHEGKDEECLALVEKFSSFALDSIPGQPLSAIITDSEDDIFTVPPTVIRKIVEELVRRLDSTLKAGLAEEYLCNSLVDSIKKELEARAEIKITRHLLGGRLFDNEAAAIAHIVRRADQNILIQPWIIDGSCFEQWVISYISVNIVRVFLDYSLAHISQPDIFSASDSDSDVENQELVIEQHSSTYFLAALPPRRGIGLPALQLTKDIWVENMDFDVQEADPELIPQDQLREITATQDLQELLVIPQNQQESGSFQQDLLEKESQTSGGNLVQHAECLLEDFDESSFIPAVKAPEAFPEIHATSSKVKQKRRLLSCASKFLRKLFCCGCILSS